MTHVAKRQSVDLKTLTLAKTGDIYDLALEFGGDKYETLPKYAVPFQQSRSFSGMSNPDIQICSEVVTGSIHHGTHIDSLAHFQMNGKIHGGQNSSSTLSESGWLVDGAETISPTVCRGVLIDLVLQSNDALPDRYSATLDEIKSAVESQNIIIKRGDAALIRTGKVESICDGIGDWSSAPGISRNAAGWLADQGAAFIGIDSPSVDAMPFSDWNDLAHIELLVKRGVYIIENLYLRGLADAKTTEFLFICSPLKFLGSSGSWVRPIAMT